MEPRFSKRKGLIMLPLAVALFSSCGVTKVSPNPLPDAASLEVGVDMVSIADGYAPDQTPPFLPLATCGGSVRGTGTSPAGEFSAASVYVRVYCSLIFVEIYDGSALSRISLAFESSAGPQALLGPMTVGVTFVGPPAGARLDTAGTVEITVATNPLPPVDVDAGFIRTDGSAPPWGMLEGSFSLGNDGFSIAGTFTSAYCSYSLVHCTI